MPSHVPEELVVSYDLLAGPEVAAFPPTALEPFRSRRVFFSPLYGGFWVLTRYEDIKEACFDTARFGQWSSGVPAVPHVNPLVPVHLNPPDHQKWRRLLVPLFTARRSADLEADLRVIARREAKRLATRGKCEFFSDYALVIPSARFCRQLGLSASDYPLFKSLADDLQYGTARVLVERGPAEAARHRGKVARRIESILSDVIADHRRSPQDDVVSALIAEEVDGAPLSDKQVLDMLSLLFFAGTDATAAQIAYAALHLATHEADRSRLVADPALWPSAVDEMLRFFASHQMSRVVREDTELAGVRLRRGDLVVLPMGAGSRDPEIFGSADTVDLERSPNPHLAFGLGIHRCVGAHFARNEIRIALDEFHKVVPDYAIDPSATVTYSCVGGKARPDAVRLLL